jgi:formate dehydrogenase assembly factor FdhD
MTTTIHREPEAKNERVPVLGDAVGAAANVTNLRLYIVVREDVGRANARHKLIGAR